VWVQKFTNQTAVAPVREPKGQFYANCGSCIPSLLWGRHVNAALE